CRVRPRRCAAPERSIYGGTALEHTSRPTASADRISDRDP
ncbi:MAG: hypothetical protein AVDCRST_MAG49-3221, partial [uncultured Thermomicrobiales bacterium]